MLIPIVLAFTPNYIIPASVVIYSILKNSSQTDAFRFICLLTEDLTQSQKDAIQSIDSNRASFAYINLKGKLKDIYIDDRYTEAASYRLLLPELLPEYDIVIYIDCDVVVRNDIANLYRKVNIENYYLAGVFEPTLDFQYEYLNSISIKPDNYINSGFLIMNLKMLRDHKMCSKFIEASKVSYLQFPDQDVLNQLCEGRILGLSPIYNSIRTFFLPQYKTNFLKKYTEKDWQDVQCFGNIHYTGGKPWDTYSIKFSEWWDIFNLLPLELRKNYSVNSKVKLMSVLFRVKFLVQFVDKVLNFYRRIKYLKK